MATLSASTDVLDITDLVRLLRVLKDNHFPDNQWDNLGLQLGVIQTELDTIREDKQNSNDRLKECLSRWLHQNYDTVQYGKPTMESLAAAVRGMGLKAVASGMEQEAVPAGVTEQHGEARKRLHIRRDIREVQLPVFHSATAELKDLHTSFSILVGKVRSRLEKMITEGKVDYTSIACSLEEFLSIKGLNDLESIHRLFHFIRDHYYYLNPSVIEFIVNEFLAEKKSCMKYIIRWFVSKAENLEEELRMFLNKLSIFENSTQLQEFKLAINEAFSTHHLPSYETTCEVVIKLNDCWNTITVQNLNLLLKHYFHRRYFFNHIRFSPGSICITYIVPLASTPDLIAAAAPKAGSMHRVGVFYLSINGKVLLEEKDNVNIDESLVEAVKLNDTFEVSLLMSLGADPCYQDDNGDSPMMLVSLGKRNEVKKLLLPADDWDDATKVLMESEEMCGVEEVEDNDPHSSARVNQLLTVIQELSATNTELVLSLASSKSEIEILQEKISSLSVQLINAKKMQRVGLLENERLLQDIAVMKDKLAELEEQQLQNGQLWLNQTLKQYNDESCQTDLETLREDAQASDSLLPTYNHDDVNALVDIADNVRQWLTCNNRNKGFFNRALEELESFKSISDEFSSCQILKILFYLYIISMVEETSIGNYFVPYALPLCATFKKLEPEVKPLLIVWKKEESTCNSFDSQDFVLSTIGHLLNQKRRKVATPPPSPDFYRYRNAMSLKVTFEEQGHTLHIINCDTHVEIYFTGPKEYRPEVRTLFKEAIDKSSNTMHMKCNYEYAFACPKDEKCYCIVKESEGVVDCTLCPEPADITSKDMTYWSWFIICSSESGQTYNPDDLMKKKPKDADLFMVFKDYENQYTLIGSGLDVNVADINYDAGNSKKCLSLVFDRWGKKNKDVTWGKISEVCGDFSDTFGKAQSNLRKHLSTKRVYEKYIEEPDFKP